MSDDLSDQTVLVTGAGRGIGRAIAETLARRGAHVGVVDIDPKLSTETAEAITAAGGNAMPLRADVASRQAMLEAAAQLAATRGRLTAVVNNAMWIRYEPLESVREDVLDRMLGVGVRAAFWGAQALLANLDAERGGCLINLASPVADLGTPNTSSYTAVKGAIVALTRQLAVELGPRGVRVNAIAPGAVPTPGARAIVDEKGYDLRRRQTPLGRLGREEEIAAGAAFLIGPEASFVTGEVLHVDGGISVRSL